MTAVKHLRGSPSARPTIATGRRASTRGFNVRAAKTFVRGFEKAAAPLDVDELVLLREIVYHVVKAEYWGMIEEGSLPRRSRAAFKLIESADSGLDDTRTPLHDFDLLHAAIAKSTAATWLDRFFNCLDSCLPECVTIDNRIHYALAYDRRPRADVERRLGVFLARRATIRPLGIIHVATPRRRRDPPPDGVPKIRRPSARPSSPRGRNPRAGHETAYYATRAFVAAHRHAQHQVAEFFGREGKAGDAPQTHAEAVVILESARQCASAERRIKGVTPHLVNLVKTNIIAQNVIDIQHELIAKLVRQGVRDAARSISRRPTGRRSSVRFVRRRRAAAPPRARPAASPRVRPRYAPAPRPRNIHVVAAGDPPTIRVAAAASPRLVWNIAAPHNHRPHPPGPDARRRQDHLGRARPGQRGARRRAAP